MGPSHDYHSPFWLLVVRRLAQTLAVLAFVRSQSLAVVERCRAGKSAESDPVCGKGRGGQKDESRLK